MLFSDIRGFKALAESLQPEVLAGIMNRYLTAITGVILKAGGTSTSTLAMRSWRSGMRRSRRPIIRRLAPESREALREIEFAEADSASQEGRDPRVIRFGARRRAVGEYEPWNLVCALRLLVTKQRECAGIGKDFGRNVMPDGRMEILNRSRDLEECNMGGCLSSLSQPWWRPKRRR